MTAAAPIMMLLVSVSFLSLWLAVVACAVGACGAMFTHSLCSCCGLVMSHLLLRCALSHYLLLLRCAKPAVQDFSRMSHAGNNSSNPIAFRCGIKNLTKRLAGAGRR